MLLKTEVRIFFGGGVTRISKIPLSLEPGMYLPEISAYQLELISPVTWETVDM